jgi:cysteinyl-tRNA synthetase
MDWTETGLEQAKHCVDRLYTALRVCTHIDETATIDASVMEALKDDLNVPLAISRLHDLATSINKTMDESERSRLGGILKVSAGLIGVLQQDPEKWFHGAIAGLTPEEIEVQIQARQEARIRKDFAESDRIRDALHNQGIVLEDGSAGTTWRLV